MRLPVCLREVPGLPRVLLKIIQLEEALLGRLEEGLRIAAAGHRPVGPRQLGGEAFRVAPDQLPAARPAPGREREREGGKGWISDSQITRDKHENRYIRINMAAFRTLETESKLVGFFQTPRPAPTPPTLEIDRSRQRQSAFRRF